MTTTTLEKAYRQSLSRCKATHLSKELSSPQHFVTSRSLRARLCEHDVLIQVFHQSVAKVDSMIEGNYIYKLFDREGVLLAGVGNKQIPQTIALDCLRPGIVLSEESIGTNSLSLAMDLKQPIYLPPEKHYSHLLNQWHAYTIPLQCTDHVWGYLVLSTYKQPMIQEMIVIMNLLSDQIIRAVQYTQTRDQFGLSDQQKRILRLLSLGMTEIAISLELHLSVNTIKYHKKRIFFMLDARSATEAVYKALQYKLI